jgi:hypothetical protein
MSDDITDLKASKTIPLAKLVPNDYRIWVSSAEATLTVYNCFKIVNGIEPNPTPQPDADGAIAVINQALRRQINSWETRHALAREALLKFLQHSELIKVHNFKLASQIWSRLHEEFGNVSDALHAKSELLFHSLRKAPMTSMQDHINEFTRLQADVEYHSPPGTKPLWNAQINLAFLRSLRERFEIFQQVLGDQVYIMKQGELFARVRAIIESRDTASEKPQDSIKALSLRISNDTRNETRYGQSRGGFRGGFHKGRGEFIGRKGSRGNDKPSNYRPKTKYDSTKTYQYCKRMGHNIDECWKRKRNNQNSRNNSDMEYHPTPNFQVNITRFSVNTASATSLTDPYKWIIDSASNANLTPFQRCAGPSGPRSKPSGLATMTYPWSVDRLARLQHCERPTDRIALGPE